LSDSFLGSGGGGGFLFSGWLGEGFLGSGGGGGFLFSGWLGEGFLGSGGGDAFGIISSADWVGLGKSGGLGFGGSGFLSGWLSKGFLGSGDAFGIISSAWLGEGFLGSGGGGFLFSGWLGEGFLGSGGASGITFSTGWGFHDFDGGGESDEGDECEEFHFWFGFFYLIIINEIFNCYKAGN
jgi:hypothetical protein